MQETAHIPDTVLEINGHEWGDIKDGRLAYDLDRLPDEHRAKARERLMTDPMLKGFIESTIVTRLPSEEEAKEEGAIERR